MLTLIPQKFKETPLEFNFKKIETMCFESKNYTLNDFNIKEMILLDLVETLFLIDELTSKERCYYVRLLSLFKELFIKDKIRNIL